MLLPLRFRAEQSFLGVSDESPNVIPNFFDDGSNKAFSHEFSQ